MKKFIAYQLLGALLALAAYGVLFCSFHNFVSAILITAGLNLVILAGIAIRLDDFRLEFIATFIANLFAGAMALVIFLVVLTPGGLIMKISAAMMVLFFFIFASVLAVVEFRGWKIRIRFFILSAISEQVLLAGGIYLITKFM